MKQGLLLLLTCMLLASCCTVFTGSKQAVTFMAPDGTKIYDALTNTKIAEVRKDNTVTTYIKKRRDDKQLILKGKVVNLCRSCSKQVLMLPRYGIFSSGPVL